MTEIYIPQDWTSEVDGADVIRFERFMNQTLGPEEIATFDLETLSKGTWKFLKRYMPRPDMVTVIAQRNVKDEYPLARAKTIEERLYTTTTPLIYYSEVVHFNDDGSTKDRREGRFIKYPSEEFRQSHPFGLENS